MEYQEIIDLEMEDGTLVKCVVLGYFSYCDEYEYVALMPIEGEDAKEGDCLIFRFDEDEEGYPILGQIESDEEFAKASEALDSMLDRLYGDSLDEEDS